MLLETAAVVYLTKTLLGGLSSFEIRGRSPQEKAIENYKYEILLEDTKKRAEEDNELAWLELGIRHLTGNCALKDNIEAYAWFSLGGNYSSNKIFYSLRDIVRKQMTSETIQKGYELFNKRYYKIEALRAKEKAKKTKRLSPPAKKKERKKGNKNE